MCQDGWWHERLCVGVGGCSAATRGVRGDGSVAAQHLGALRGGQASSPVPAQSTLQEAG